MIEVFSFFKHWLAQGNPVSVLVYSDQRRLTLVDLLVDALDRSCKLEVPSLLEFVHYSVLHSVTGFSFPSTDVSGYSVADGRCFGPLPCEGFEQTSCDGVEGVLRLHRRRGQPKKYLGGDPLCSGAIEPGEGVVKGWCAIMKASRPRGRPQKGKNPPLVVETEFPSSLDPPRGCCGYFGKPAGDF